MDSKIDEIKKAILSDFKEQGLEAPETLHDLILVYLEQGVDSLVSIIKEKDDKGLASRSELTSCIKILSYDEKLNNPS